MAKDLFLHLASTLAILIPPLFLILLLTYARQMRKVEATSSEAKLPFAPITSFMLLCIICLLPRLWKLTEYPRFFGWEFEHSALAAFETLRRGSPRLLSVLDLSNDAYYLAIRPVDFLADFWALCFYLFGASIFSMKLLPLAFGVAAVVLSAVVGSKLFSTRIGYCAAFLMSASPFMIGLSRELWAHVGLVTPLSLFGLYLTWLSVERLTALRSIMCCLLFGLSFHLYHAMYAFPIFLSLVWLICFVTNPDWRRRFLYFLPLNLLVTAILLYPIAYNQWGLQGKVYFSLHMETFGFWSERQQAIGVSVLKNCVNFLTHILYHGENLKFNNGVGDYMRLSGTMHLPFETLLFLVGLGSLILRLRQNSAYKLLLLYLIVGALPTLLSSVEPRRLASFEAFFFLTAGLGLECILRHLALSKSAFLNFCISALLIFHVVTGWASFHRLIVEAGSDAERSTAEYIADNISPDDKFLLLSGHAGLLAKVLLLTNSKLDEKVSRRSLVDASTQQALSKLEAEKLRSVIHFIVRGDRVKSEYRKAKFTSCAKEHFSEGSYQAQFLQDSSKASFKSFYILQTTAEQIPQAIEFLERTTILPQR